MEIGWAIAQMRGGARVRRAGWNGKGMWLVLIKGSHVVPYPDSPYENAPKDQYGKVTINPHIDMRTATGEMQPGWLASQTDLLADDWEVIALSDQAERLPLI